MKRKTYKCENCMKSTSTTNEKFYKRRLCKDCRDMTVNIDKITPEEEKADVKKWTTGEIAFVLLFFSIMAALLILCMTGNLPGC